jgi:hypothetical protein
MILQPLVNNCRPWVKPPRCAHIDRPPRIRAQSMRIEIVRVCQNCLFHQAHYIRQHQRPAEGASVLDREEVRHEEGPVVG